MAEIVNLSCVLLVPTALSTAADQLSIGLGYAQPGDVTYALPILKDGVETYKGAHTRASSSFVTLIENARDGIIPAELDADPVQVQALVNSMIISIRDSGEPLNHWNDVLAEYGLTQPVVEEDV